MNEIQFPYHQLKDVLIASRGRIVRLIDKALEDGVLTHRERDVLYRRLADWKSLQKVGEEIGLTRERIRQIEAKAEEKLRSYEAA